MDAHREFLDVDWSDGAVGRADVDAGAAATLGGGAIPGADLILVSSQAMARAQAQGVWPQHPTGDIVIMGSFVRQFPLAPGRYAEADFSGVGRVTHTWRAEAAGWFLNKGEAVRPRPKKYAER